MEIRVCPRLAQEGTTNDDVSKTDVKHSGAQINVDIAFVLQAGPKIFLHF